MIGTPPPLRHPRGAFRPLCVGPALLLLLSALGSGALGCSGDTLNGLSSRFSPTQTYWALQLNQHAVILALTPPYDTVQLTAVPVNSAGVPLVGLGAVTYKSTDSALTVDSTGLVTAHFVTQGTPRLLIATLQDVHQRITHTDTVAILVTQTPDTLATFSLQPAPGDSAKRAIDYLDNFIYTQGQYVWAVTAIDAVGDTVCSDALCTIPVYYHSSHPTIATIDHATGIVTNLDTGRVMFTARSLVYGKVKQDSLEFTVGYALNEDVRINYKNNSDPNFNRLFFSLPSSQLIMGVGATVSFFNATFQPIDIVFDNPATVDTASAYLGGFPFVSPSGTGNISPFGGSYNVFYPCGTCTSLDSGVSLFDPNDYVGRSFPVAGTYHVSSTLSPSLTPFELVIRKETF